MNQFIRASWYTPRLAYEAKEKIQSSKVDFVAQGYSPTTENPNGVLLEIKDLPLAYWDIPTLNRMIFGKPLWEALLANEDLLFRMHKLRSFWGEADHSDRSEIHLPDVSHKVTDFRLNPDKFVVGDVSVLDTPNGNILYTLMQDGAVGWSSRGWGDLVKNKQDPHLLDVLPEAYTHICWDAVGEPAVPECLSSIVSNLRRTKVDEAVLSYLRKDGHSVYSSIKDKLEEVPVTIVVPENKIVKSSEEETPPENPAEVIEEDTVVAVDEETRDAFTEAVLSEVSLTSVEVKDNKIAGDIKLLLEEGYLIQEDVAEGQSALPSGTLALDLYSEFSGSVQESVKFIVDLVTGIPPLPEEEIQVEE